MAQSIGPSLRENWQRFSNKPGGKWLFSRIIGFTVPYTGSIGAKVAHLEPGHGRVTLKERRKVSNHLHSVHAIALVNLAEMVTGLTLLNSLPEDARGILTGMKIQYHHKARGLLTAECVCEIPESNEEKEMQISGEIKNEAGDIVATAIATWRIGPENQERKARKENLG
ncbi:MAG: acyl-coenzyme A thioesterase PaaI-like protein [Gammaproteobacteria bacterium]|jgi:acyl-coenzyme A thioesterase PaaI-like protein